MLVLISNLYIYIYLIFILFILFIFLLFIWIRIWVGMCVCSRLQLGTMPTFAGVRGKLQKTSVSMDTYLYNHIYNIGSLKI